MRPYATSYGGGGGAGAGAGDDAGTGTDFDAEYDAVVSIKLATKDTKYDFKAQMTVAKAWGLTLWGLRFVRHFFSFPKMSRHCLQL